MLENLPLVRRQPEPNGTNRNHGSVLVPVGSATIRRFPRQSPGNSSNAGDTSAEVVGIESKKYGESIPALEWALRSAARGDHVRRQAARAGSDRDEPLSGSRVKLRRCTCENTTYGL